MTSKDASASPASAWAASHVPSAAATACPSRLRSSRRNVQAARAEILDAAYLAHSERFVSKLPAPPCLPGTLWINPPQEKEASTQ
ncbi:MAG TPA: hypothetical protein VG253_19110 [Streptosporangiaceae bacterium]|nr:hypothetical protein [Streptosporangiaceae bacterium]